MRENVNVRSVNDVITNSSNEAYIYCSGETLDSIKTLFDSIVQFLVDDTKLGLSNGKIPKFDDYFEISEGFYDEEWVLDYWKDSDEAKEKPSGYVPTKKELYEWAQERDNYDSEGGRMTGKLVVRAKPGTGLKASQLAILLENIPNYFNVEVRYN